MVPATDRDSMTPARWLGVGFALALSAVGPGCTPWKSGRRDAPPPMLGMQQTSRDAYLDGHRRKPTPPVAATPPAGSVADAPLPTDGLEVGMAIRSDDNTEPTVALQAPIPSNGPAPKESTGGPSPSRSAESAEPRPGPVDPARLVAEARATLDRMANYRVSLHRQERVNGSLQPEEDVLLAFRRDPKAVRLTWPTGPHRGREVLYRADEPGGLMHVNMADSALPIPRLSIPPDSPMVMRNSRHPITEAGFEPLIRGLEEAQQTPGPTGLVYGGLETPAPFDHPLHCLIRVARSGEVSRVYVDPETHLPGLFLARSSSGELLERYVFQDVRPDLAELRTAEAFDPNARWGPSRGLLGRIARGADSTTATPPR
jgi:hypothetical protein